MQAVDAPQPTSKRERKDPPRTGGWLKLVTAKGKELLELVRSASYSTYSTVSCEEHSPTPAHVCGNGVHRWTMKPSPEVCTSSRCALGRQKRTKDAIMLALWPRTRWFGSMNAQTMKGSVFQPCPLFVPRAALREPLLPD